MSIRELLGFQKGAPKQVHEHGGTLEGFWSMITREAHQQRNSIQNPIIQVFHSWMCKRILGRMRETKITDMEVNWLCSALIARQPIDPTHLNDQQVVLWQHRVREILARGVTSPYWLSL
jgi:hypothetical protein